MIGKVRGVPEKGHMLWLCFVHPYLCSLAAAVRNGEIEAIQLRHEQRRPSARRGRSSPDWLIMIGVFLLKNTYRALAAGNIHAPARAVVEYIVGVSGTLQLGNDLTRLGVKNDEARRLSEADEQPVMGFVERHRIIRRGIARRPCRSHCSFFPIDDVDLPGRGNIHKDARSIFLQLKRLGMALELDFADAITTRRVDHRKSAAAIADEDMPLGRIVPDVVSVVRQFEAFDALERGAVENIAVAAFPVGDKVTIEFRYEGYTLRLL